MARDPVQGSNRLSRAAVLKRAGALGAAAAIPAALGSQEQASAAQTLRAVETLTSHEFETLSAMTARLIPADANGPGALDAHASTYVDRALNSHYSYLRDNYTENLAAIDAYTTSVFGAPFASLPPDKQDQALTAMERNTPRTFGFNPDPLTFLNLVLAHTQEGMFSDPYYGGNANFVGWDLLGFAGVKLEFKPSEQRLNVDVPKSRRSTYSYALFKGRAS